MDIIKNCTTNNGEEFIIHLLNVDAEMKDYYLQKSEQYRFLSDTDETMVFIINNNGSVREALIEKKDVVKSIEIVIQELIQYEMYEQCAVLQNVKEEFKNGNKR